MPSLNLGSMRGLPNDAISHGSSTINFMRQLGGAVGIAVVGSVLEWRLHAEAGTPLRAFHETFMLVGAITGLAMAAAWLMKPARARLGPAAELALELAAVAEDPRLAERRRPQRARPT